MFKEWFEQHSTQASSTASNKRLNYFMSILPLTPEIKNYTHLSGGVFSLTLHQFFWLQYSELQERKI